MVVFVEVERSTLSLTRRRVEVRIERFAIHKRPGRPHLIPVPNPTGPRLPLEKFNTAILRRGAQ